MPSVLDFLDDPHLLNSILGGAPGGGTNPGAPPPAPPPQVMASASPQLSPTSAFDANMLTPGAGPSPTLPPKPPDAFDPSVMPNSGNVAPQPPLSFADRYAPVDAAKDIGTFSAPGQRDRFAGTQPPTLPLSEMRKPMTLGAQPPAAMPPSGAPPLPPPSAYAPQSAPPTTAAQGGLAGAFGLSPQAWGQGVAALGKGLSAVGQMRPGSFGAANFAAGMGGALTGGVEEGHKQREFARQDKNDLFTQSSTAFRDMLAADAREDSHAHTLASIDYLKARAAGTALSKGQRSWRDTPEGRVATAEQRVAAFDGPKRKSIDALVKTQGLAPEEAKALYDKLDKESESYRQRIYQSMGINSKEAENLKTMGSRENPYDAKSMTEDEFNLRVPMGGYFKDHNGKLRQRTKPPPGAENQPQKPQYNADSYGESVDTQTALTPPATG